MHFKFFLRGLVIGFSIAAPVGPIGVLCIRRTLTEGLVRGLVSGFGAAAADAIYGAIAAFGLTFISDVLIRQQFWFRLAGGLFLCYLGARTFRANPRQESLSIEDPGLLHAFGTTLFLTLTNPLTILSFAAIFAALGVGGAGSYLSAGIMVAGVFAGSAFWWLILSGGVSLAGKMLSPSMLKWVNRVSGAIIMAFGLLALLSLNR